MKLAEERLSATVLPIMFVACGLICTFASTVRANEASDISAIKAVYAMRTRAFRQKDIKTLLSVLTPDCTVKDHGRILKVPQLKTTFTNQARQIQSIKAYREAVT